MDSIRTYWVPIGEMMVKLNSIPTKNGIPTEVIRELRLGLKEETPTSDVMLI